MRMMQYELKLNRDNGTGYYVSSCANEESVRLFSDKGRPIEMKILERRGGDLVSSIDAIGSSGESKKKLEKEFREHLEEIFSGDSLGWRLVRFEVCAECIILEYYRPDSGELVSVTLGMVALCTTVLQVEFSVPGRREGSMEKYTIRQSSGPYPGNDVMHSYTHVIEQINGIRRDLEFSYDDSDRGCYVAITEYAG
jgi:hypothetical protein